MAYVTCPWCLAPQLVGDEADEYRCFTCNGKIRFFQCPHCGLVQSVNRDWAAFTCGKCDRKVDLPRQYGYAGSARAVRAEGTALPWPKF